MHFSREVVAYALCVSILVALLVASMWVVEWLPTTDGLQHAYMGWMSNHLDDPGTNYSLVFGRNVHVTNYGFLALFEPLEGLLPWRDAYRLTLSIILVAWALGALVLSTAIHRRVHWPSLLLVPAALQWSIYMGFFSYSLSTAVGFAVVAYVVWRREPRFVDRVIVGAALTMQAALHLFPALIVGAVLGVVVIARHAPQARKTLAELVWLAVASVPTLVVLWLASQGGGDGSASDDRAAPMTLMTRLLVTPELAVPGGTLRSWPVFSAAVAGYVAAIAPWGLMSREARSLVFAGLTALVVFTFAPMDLPGWRFFAPRFAATAIVFGVILVPFGTTVRMFASTASPSMHSRLGLPLVVALTLFCAGSLLGAARLHGTIEGAFSAVDAPIERSRFRAFVPLELCFEDETTPHALVPLVRYQNGGEIPYVLDQGGMAVVFHGLRAIHNLTMQAPDASWHVDHITAAYGYELGRLSHAVAAGTATDEDREQLQKLSTHVALAATTFEDLILAGPPEARAVVVSRGFIADVENDSVFVGRFRGCPMAVQLPAEVVATTPAIVEYGWYPLTDAVLSAIVVDPVRAATPLDLPRHPCGQAWMRVVFDADRSGSLSTGDSVCEGTDRNGVLFYEHASATRQVFTCSGTAPR